MGLLHTIKQAAVEAVEASKPMQAVFGRVEGVSPLKIKIDQRFAVGADFLIVSQRWQGNLKEGDRVLLLQQKGGQQFIIIDRM